MLKFEVHEVANYLKNYFNFWKSYKKSVDGFLGPDMFLKKIILKKLKINQACHEHKVFVLNRGNRPILMCIFFKANANRIKSSLGFFCCKQDISLLESDFFWDEVKKYLKDEKVIFPLNGHHYLGFGLPDENLKPGDIGIFLNDASDGLKKVFKSNKIKKYRTYYSLKTRLDIGLKTKLNLELKKTSQEFEVRKFSKLFFHRDITIFNQLVNNCFTEHFDFWPLSDSEAFDIMKWSVSLIDPDLFLFMYRGNEPIGFCMAMPDYNQLGLNSMSDLGNIARFLFNKNKINRGRLIHIGIKKEFRGKGLIKILRHRVILNMIKKGYKFVENSVIDEKNKNSMSNVLSTGAEHVGDYTLFTV